MKVISYEFESSLDYPSCIVEDKTGKYKIKCYPYGIYFFDNKNAIKPKLIVKFLRKHNEYIVAEFRTMESINEMLNYIIVIAEKTETFEDIINILQMEDIL